MSKYEIFMKRLESSGCIKGLQKAKQFTPDLPGMPPELQKQLDMECVKRSVMMTLERTPSLKAAFADAAQEVMFDRMIADLDLKKDPNYQRTAQDDFIMSLVNLITGVKVEDLFNPGKTEN